MTNPTMPEFLEWVKTVDDVLTGDPLWSVQAYRLGMYAIACHNSDQRSVPALGRAPALDQLTRAIGSVSANIAEGYSRSSIKDRNKFYDYALGSVREAIAWYDTLRNELGDAVTARQSTLIQIRRLLLTMLRRARSLSALSAIHDPTREPRKDS